MTLIRICKFKHKSIRHRCFDKPRIKLFKLLNMPGFAMENDYYSSSKQKEIKKKVIQTFPIFPKKSMLPQGVSNTSGFKAAYLTVVLRGDASLGIDLDSNSSIC